MIEFEGVTKVFAGGIVGVDELSMVAPTGRITVLMGPRGSGKTTLLRMVNRMVDPSDGRVLVDEVPNTNVRRSALRRGIGYVVPGGLFPHRSVLGNIATVPLLLGHERGKARERATRLLEYVGLSAAFADKYPGQLTAGQQMRVALARALAADPPVLLLDSPFKGLEPAVRQDLQDDLLELQRLAPKTILFTTEDIDEAIKLGDQIAVLAAGRLVQVATPQVLLAQPGSDYVADLLGRDRGIRKLSFLAAGDLPLVPPATVQAGTTGSRAQALAYSDRERWLLVLDPDRRPRGWVDSALLAPNQVISGAVVHPLAGTFYPDESILAALDAAILSPSGLAVCLHDDGKVLGVVSHIEIARHLAALPPIPVHRPAAEAQPLVTSAVRPEPAAEPMPGGSERSERTNGYSSPAYDAEERGIVSIEKPSPVIEQAPVDAGAGSAEHVVAEPTLFRPGTASSQPSIASTTPAEEPVPRPARASQIPVVKESTPPTPAVPIAVTTPVPAVRAAGLPGPEGAGDGSTQAPSPWPTYGPLNGNGNGTAVTERIPAPATNGAAVEDGSDRAQEASDGWTWRAETGEWVHVSAGSDSSEGSGR